MLLHSTMRCSDTQATLTLGREHRLPQPFVQQKHDIPFINGPKMEPYRTSWKAQARIGQNHGRRRFGNESERCLSLGGMLQEKKGAKPHRRASFCHTVRYCETSIRLPLPNYAGGRRKINGRRLPLNTPIGSVFNSHVWGRIQIGPSSGRQGTHTSSCDTGYRRPQASLWGFTDMPLTA